VELEDAPGLSIPDDDATGIERALSVTAIGTVRDVAVGVDITHTYIGDLEVFLVSPAGTTVKLHQRRKARPTTCWPATRRRRRLGSPR
jgi:subtilisin-like proprotein convertase family protein